MPNCDPARVTVSAPEPPISVSTPAIVIVLPTVVPANVTRSFPESRSMLPDVTAVPNTIVSL